MFSQIARSRLAAVRVARVSVARPAVMRAPRFIASRPFHTTQRLNADEAKAAAPRMYSPPLPTDPLTRSAESCSDSRVVSCGAARNR